MIQVKRVPCGTVNCFLLPGPEGAVLVDTGRTRMPEREEKLRSLGPRTLYFGHERPEAPKNQKFFSESP